MLATIPLVSSSASLSRRCRMMEGNRNVSRYGLSFGMLLFFCHSVSTSAIFQSGVEPSHTKTPVSTSHRNLAHRLGAAIQSHVPRFPVPAADQRGGQNNEEHTESIDFATGFVRIGGVT